MLKFGDVLAREDDEVLQTMTEYFVGMGALSSWKTASLFGNRGIHLITQTIHVLPCSNLVMKGNNATNRILYHHITAQTITEPPPCFTVGPRHSGLQASLGVLQT
jgi:hypothetical protein